MSRLNIEDKDDIKFEMNILKMLSDYRHVAMVYRMTVFMEHAKAEIAFLDEEIKR